MDAHLIGIHGSGMRGLAEVLHGWGWEVSGSDMTLPPEDFSANRSRSGLKPSEPIHTISSPLSSPLPSPASQYEKKSFGSPSPDSEGFGQSGSLAARHVVFRFSSEKTDSPCTSSCAGTTGNAKNHSAIRFFQGHAAENVADRVDLVVRSEAIPLENPEVMRATELGIPVLNYFEALGRLSEGGKTLAVAGTHGKSTTTALLAHLLQTSGKRPTVFCGATPIGRHSGGVAGGSDRFVIEACEYRKNFLHLRPRHAAILGIEPDHFDCFDQLPEIEAAFVEFGKSIPSDGLLVYRAECPSTQRVVRQLGCRRVSFGFSSEADWSAQNLRHERGSYRFTVIRERQSSFEVSLSVPGRHNVLNALAAMALAWEEGVGVEPIQEGLVTFPGLHCRFEILRGIGSDWPILGDDRTPVWVADYAHHPTEVVSALKTAREVFPHRTIWCIFQPHQASRTARFLDELAFSLHHADKVIVAEIFRAREGAFRPGEVTASDLRRRVQELAEPMLSEGEDSKRGWPVRGPEIVPVSQPDEILRTVANHVDGNDVVVILGAGDIHRWAWGALIDSAK